MKRSCLALPFSTFPVRSFVFAGVMLVAASLRADVYWVLPAGQSGDWSAALNWSGAPPTSSDIAFISNGGQAVVTQSGETCNDLVLGYNPAESGTMQMISGGLSATQQFVGYSGTGTITQSGGANSGGDLTVGFNVGSSGTYNLSGDGQLVADPENVGGYGTGTFTQSGGTNSTGGNLQLGFSGSSGTYSLSGSGVLSVTNYEIVGLSGTGSFTQSGGTNNSGNLIVGYNIGSAGAFNLSGSGYLSVPNNLSVGYSGTSSFTQSGGTNSVSGLVIAANSGSAGTYNLNGGLLSLSALTQGGGAATFNFAGGTFQAASSFSTSVPIALTTGGSNAVFDTNGNMLTLAGPLSGPGGLQVIGAGVLTLAVSNGYTGTTLVSNGTLLLGDPNALSGSTFDTTGGGLLSFGGLTSALFGGLQGSGNLALSNANFADVALTVGGNNASTTFSGNLSDLNGGGSLTKTGTGLLLLSGDNSYGGGTTVSSGTLEVVSSSALPDGMSLTVGAGGTLVFDPSAPGSPFTNSAAAVAVPEPSTSVLLGVGAIGLVVYRWRRRLS